MENTNYNCAFTVKNTPGEVFDSICNVNGWWGNTKGNTKHLNDEFRYGSGETYVDFKITEMIPGKKIVWTVTDCYLHWLTDKKEWNGTSVNFNITETAEGTQVSMVHMGLTPQVECFEDCKKGWNFHAGESLQKLITENKGTPAWGKAA